MRTDFFIARRLRLKQSGSHRSAISVRISTAGVALSIAVMLLTVAIVTGFKQQIVDKITGFDADISIYALGPNGEGEIPIRYTNELESAIRQAISAAAGSEIAAEANISRSVSQPGMLKTDDNFLAVAFRGYAPGHNYAFLEENIVERGLPAWGDDEEADNTIVLSTAEANSLGLKAGDKINTVFFIDGKLRLRNFKVGALYCSNFNEYDQIVAFAPMSVMQKMRRLDADESTRIEISGLPLKEIPEVQAQLQQRLSSAYYAGEIDAYCQTVSVLQSSAIYFNWLHLLDTNVLVITILMGAISVFTLIAALFILILERVNLIGTLKTIGGDNSLIRRIFIILASKILLKGLAIGNVIALAIIIFQSATHALPLDAESYYISFVPVSISAIQVAIINSSAIAAGILVMIIPSAVITRMSPAKSVRFD